MFGLSPFKLLVVFGILMLLFGNRLPSTMRSLGRGVVEFKKGLAGTDEESEQASSGKTAAPKGQ